MARIGVTYQDIANVASQLLGQGKAPTIELIRQVLGTGSSTTIANHLRQWRLEQRGAEGQPLQEGLPPELVAMMKGLWERLNYLTEDKITAAQQLSEQLLLKTEQELTKYKRNNQRWQKLYHQWNNDKQRLLNENAAQLNRIETLDKTRLSLEVRQAEKAEQLVAMQARIEELQHLHEIGQRNLEIYRTERQQEQVQFQQQKYDWQQALQMKQAEVQALSEAAMSSQQQCRMVQQAYERLEVANQDAAVALQQAAEINISQQDEIVSLQQQLSEFRSRYDSQVIKAINSQAEAHMYAQQLSELKSKIS